VLGYCVCAKFFVILQGKEDISMISTAEIKTLMLDLENDRVERTISTTNTDKFGQAICAMANDLPNHRLPGYLMLGVCDDGKVSGLEVTDALLRDIAAIRTDGNIQPQPSMVVEKVSLPEGDIVVVEVQPHVFPPIRYKGRIWVRIGPRKGIANEADERILLEKRRSQVSSFETEPCLNAQLEDLDLDLFRNTYLLKVMRVEDVVEDKRDVRYILSSFGFYDTNYDCPTNAGILFFAKNLRRWLPSAYVQYVRMKGTGKVGEILTDYEFKENLCKSLADMDSFIRTTVVNNHPVKVSALREIPVIDYPEWATRELLMNAVCHRDYAARGPVQFYQYDDRIEIQNPGGLYGRANVDNFPNVNDYRNLLIAETMKTLGYVNRHSKGVLRVQTELTGNENGLPEYDFSYGTAIRVTEHKTKMEERLLQGVVKENEKKCSEMAENMGEMAEIDQKPPFRLPIIKDVYEAIKMNKRIKYEQLQDNLGIGESTVRRSIQWLKDNGYISKIHSKVNGEWQLMS